MSKKELLSQFAAENGLDENALTILAESILENVQKDADVFMSTRPDVKMDMLIADGSIEGRINQYLDATPTAFTVASHISSMKTA